MTLMQVVLENILRNAVLGHGDSTIWHIVVLGSDLASSPTPSTASLQECGHEVAVRYYPPHLFSWYPTLGFSGKGKTFPPWFSILLKILTYSGTGWIVFKGPSLGGRTIKVSRGEVHWLLTGSLLPPKKIWYTIHWTKF